MMRTTFTDDKQQAMAETKTCYQPQIAFLSTPWSKQTRQQTLQLSVTLPNNDRFSKFFLCYTQQEICNKATITDPAKP